MKILNWFFSVMFVLFAALQYNDPDPYIWVPLYLYAAFLCMQAAKNRFYPKAFLVGMFIYIIYAAFLFFDSDGVISWAKNHDAENLVHTMKAEKPWIEETREFGGLIILFISMLANYLKSKKSVA
ncbi:MAG: transmembrane 220 family protein [Chitinophagaceae bacterium]